jgi:hypothetical protein
MGLMKMANKKVKKESIIAIIKAMSPPLIPGPRYKNTGLILL